MARRIAAQLLSSYLLVWVPATFAVELLSVLPSIGMRGPAAWIELAVHGAVAIMCAVAGRMIRDGTGEILRVNAVSTELWIPHLAQLLSIISGEDEGRSEALISAAIGEVRGAG